jgi:hypothetical protein
VGEAAGWQNWQVIAYSFMHSPAAGVAPADYEAALADFIAALAGAGIAGLRRCRSVRFEVLPWVPGRPAYQDWYELDGSAALDTLERGAVAAAMEARHSAVARLAGNGSGGLFASRSDGSSLVFADGWEPRVAWIDKPAGAPYGSFVAGLRDAVEPVGEVWQRRLSLGPGREFCLWLPAARGSDEGPTAGLPAGSLIVSGLVVAASEAS